MREGVLWVVLSWADIDTLVGVVAASELVAVHDAEDTVVNVEIHADAEIGPVVVTGAIGLEQFCAFQENTLRDA